MLPVCSATTGCSTHSQICIHGGLRSTTYWITSEIRCNVVDRAVPDLFNKTHPQGVWLGKQPAKLSYSNFMDQSERSGSVNTITRCSFHKELNDHQFELLSNGCCTTGGMNESFATRAGSIQFVENSDMYAQQEELMVFMNQIDETNISPQPANPDSILSMDGIQDDPSLPPDTYNADTDSLSSIKTSVVDVVAETNKSISDIVNEGQNFLNSSIDTVISSIQSAFREANEALNNATGELKSSTDRIGELAGSKLSSLSSDLKEASGRLGITALDGLRQSIIVVEESLAKGFTSAAYGYGTVKELLPTEIQNALSASENKLSEFLRPVGSAFQQGYSTLQGLEEKLGLDPNDPIIPFLLFIGASASLWVYYWVYNYSGYTGDLSPRSTLELLTGNEDGVLIDIRPEDLRERDGIPDLRRAARYRYASIVLPEVDVSLKKLLKAGRNLDDLLIAAVIGNLKNVQDRSKVVVLDAKGVRSKGIARALRKLGVKNSYVVQGGFQSWVREGLRIKDLRPETALTILNEDAEAIIQDFNPTPLRLLGYGMGFAAVSYAAIEWEKTLQIVGIIGLGQSIYKRIASYENTEDFKQDVRLLLAPARLGGQAISWATGKLETNRNGLPTSPSSSDVQSRVLQAAAKHESQPSDSEDTENPSPEVTGPKENMDLSEA
ncbi:uncharacterized protein [Coffea arabica]|uniref:Rhodanese domain-containing protein n=1 Tax=Coffea arabica TaxID=13443 RepID=A0A6P6WWX6_COFAR|nr:uncharacterized protein LOC113736914 [Coffea arabica]XP_027119920.1 uncharacterized protein LOC113736914 [Coffea arabica]